MDSALSGRLLSVARKVDQVVGPKVTKDSGTLKSNPAHDATLPSGTSAACFRSSVAHTLSHSVTSFHRRAVPGSRVKVLRIDTS
jgi:hypothetical protein